MSGTGKSTALAELRRRGFEVVNTDEPGWTKWCAEDGGYVRREDDVAELLAATAGCRLTQLSAIAVHPDRDQQARGSGTALSFVPVARWERTRRRGR